MMTAEPTAAAFGVKLVMLGGGIVSVEALLTRPPDVLTVTLPEIVPAGTCAVIAVSDQLISLFETPEPANVIEPQLVWPQATANPDPLIVIVSPGVAEDGEILEMSGLTVKLSVLLALPGTSTITVPVRAPSGTVI